MLKLPSSIFRELTQSTKLEPQANNNSTPTPTTSIPYAATPKKSQLPENASPFSMYSNLPKELQLEVLDWLQESRIHEEFKIQYASVKDENEAVSRIIPEEQRNLWEKICRSVSANTHQQQDSDVIPSNESLIKEIASFNNNEHLLKGLTYPVLKDLARTKNALFPLHNEKKALRLLDDVLQSDVLSCQSKHLLLNNLAYVTLSEPHSAKVRSEVGARVDVLRIDTERRTNEARVAVSALSEGGFLTLGLDNNPDSILRKSIKCSLQLVLRHQGIAPSESKESVKKELNDLFQEVLNADANTVITKTIQVDGVDHLVLHATRTNPNTLMLQTRFPVADAEDRTPEELVNIESKKHAVLVKSISESVNIHKAMSDALLGLKPDNIWRDNDGGAASIAMIDKMLTAEKNYDVRAKVLKGLLAVVKARDGHSAHMAVDSKLVDIIEKYTKQGANGLPSLVGNHDTDLIINLVDAMGNMRAAKLQDSWETGAELLRKEKKRTDTLDPQMRAYKVVKRYLNNATQYPSKVEKVISAIWENNTLDKMSASGRRIQTSHWKKGVTSIAVTGAIYGVTHALVPALEVGLGIDLKLAAAKEKLNLDIGILDKINTQLSDVRNSHHDISTALEKDKELITVVDLDINQQAESIPNSSAVNEFLKNNTEVHVVNGQFVMHDTDQLTDKIPSFGGAVNQAGNTSIGSLDNLALHIKATSIGQNPGDIVGQNPGDISDLPKSRKNYVDYDKLMQCLDKSDPSNLSTEDQETILNLRQSLEARSRVQAHLSQAADLQNSLNADIKALSADHWKYDAAISNDNELVSQAKQNKEIFTSIGNALHPIGVQAEIFAIANEKSKNKILDSFFRTGSKTFQELKTWGPVGIRNIAKASYKAIDEEVLSSPREALRRLTPEILKKSRTEEVRQTQQRARSEQAIEQERQAEQAVEDAHKALDLENKFAQQTEHATPAVNDAQAKRVVQAQQALEEALKKQSAQKELAAPFDNLHTIASTWQIVLENLHSKDLSLDRKAETLHECIKELDHSRVLPIHHERWESAREDAMHAADRLMLIDALPKLKSHPASYAWLAEYLMHSEATIELNTETNTESNRNGSSINRAPLSQQTTRGIESTLRKYASPLGPLQRAHLRTSAIKAGHTIVPAWLRPDFGFIGGQQGRRDRTAAIETKRANLLLNRQEKAEKIAGSAQKLQETLPTEQGKILAKSVVDRLKISVPAPQEGDANAEE